MASKFIILVSDRDDEKHGEVSVHDDVKKAQRLVETLIEAGFEQERIRVFGGGELDIQVTQRPVVSIVKNEGSGEDHQGEEGDEGDSDSSEEGEATEAGAKSFSSLFRSG